MARLQQRVDYSLYLTQPDLTPREELLRRIRELDAEIAQLERKLREGEARLPIEEQIWLSWRRLIYSAFH